MKMNEKLALQQELGGLVLFKDGLFLRAYNESVYILTQLLGHHLKVSPLRIKKYKNAWFVTCAFPASKLSERLPKAVITDFGGQLAGDFNLSGYDMWHKQFCHQESIANAGANAGNEALKTSERPASELYVDENLTDILLPLTEQQHAFLQTWQKGLYPLEVDLGFIESLKAKLTPSKH